MALTPYLIQLGNTIYGYHSDDGNGGPYEWNGNQYAFVNITSLPAEQFIRAAIYKTTDQQNWTEQDSANSPAVNKNGAWSIFYPKAGGSIIYVGYFVQASGSTGAASPLALKSFDMSTDTWTTLATGGPNAAANSGIETQILVSRQTTGQFVFQYVGPSFQAFTATWSSGGGWSAGTQIGTGFPAPGVWSFPILQAIDAADKVYMLWYSYDNIGGQGNRLYCNTFTSGGSLSGKTLILVLTPNQWDPGGWDTVTGWNLQGKYITSANRIAWVLPFIINPNAVIRLLDLDCSTGIFTFSDIVSDGATGAGLWTDFDMNSGETEFSAMYCNGNDVTGPSQVIQVKSTVWLPSWGSPTTWYDQSVTPPVPVPPQLGTDSLAVRYLSGGINALIGMDSTQDSLSLYQAQFAAVGSSGISIACPIGGSTATVGVLYTSAAPVVTSGTPPYIFSLVSGPPWMMINAATGAVSGIPSATGSVTFTEKVTDSLGATATVSGPCGPITVTAGPDVCEQVPATGPETLVLYNEPLEQQGT